LSFIFVTSVSFAQYKYDVGLKTSTYDRERFQLEQRFHFNSPWSLVVTMTTGSQSDGAYSQSLTYNDSLFDVNFNNSQIRNGGLKIGVQRKLGFFATDVFYAGASLGFGLQKQRDYYTSTTYSNPGIGENIPGFNTEIEEVSSVSQLHESSEINSQLALSFGMDVPISKRLSINAELGFAGMLSRSLTYDFSIIDLFGSVSGGLRYQLGVRK
jgi:hypothetical protein